MAIIGYQIIVISCNGTIYEFVVISIFLYQMPFIVYLSFYNIGQMNQ